MSKIPTKAYNITLNDQTLCVIWSTGYYAAMIMDDMREAHFCEVYGVDISAKTSVLEEAYEKEYSWDFLEVDILTNVDAERRCEGIIARKAEIVETNSP